MLQRLSLTLLSLVFSSCVQARAPGGQQEVASSNQYAQNSDLLIVPGVKLGHLRIGLTKRETYDIFPKRRNYDFEISHSSCDLTERSLVAPDGRGSFKFYFNKDDVVFQIQAHMRDEYHTREGITYESGPELISRDFPRVRTLIAQGTSGKTTGPRDLMYLIEDNKGIAFEMYYNESAQSYLVRQVIVFQPGKFYLPYRGKGCPQSVF